jgi:lysophospholipase L1-like esterase
MSSIQQVFAGLGAFSPAQLFGAGDKGGIYSCAAMAHLWQDTAGTVPVTAVGQTVKRIDDISGNGLHVTNAAGWVLGQDANGSKYLTASGTSLFSAPITWTGAALTLACAYNVNASPGSNNYLVSVGNTGNANDWGGLYLSNTSGAPTLVANGAFGSGSVVASQGIPSDPNVSIATSSGPTIARDLLQVVGTNTITGLAPLNVLSIGGLTRSIVGSYYTGKFYGAVAITRSVSSAELHKLNNWLRSLYGNFDSFVAIGDSFTFNTTYGQTEVNFYARCLETALRNAGRSYQSINLGVSGNTTANMVARLSDVTNTSPHQYGILYGGINDNSGTSTVQASPAPTNTTFSVASTFGQRYGTGGLIFVGAASAQVLSVAGDAITLTAPLAGGAPAAGTAVSIDTQSNLVKVGQTMQGYGTTRLLVPGLHYYNFASGLGDTTTTPNPNAASIRASQQAAATALSAVYVDLYAFMRALIVAGTYTQGDDLAWHVAVSNAHLNNTGEQILANAFFAALQSQGWA